MKKNFFAVLVCIAIQSMNGQINSKLAVYKNDASYDKQNRLNFISIAENSPVKETEMLEFIDNIVLGNSSTKAMLLKVEKDDVGFTHTKYTVSQNGLPLQNKIIIAHCKDGLLKSLNGDLYSLGNPVNKFVISEATALKFALKKVNAKKYKWQNKAEEAHMREVLNDPSFSYAPVGAKVIYEKDGKTFNAFRFNIYAEMPLYRANVYVDAASGKILGEETLICNVNVPGTAATKYSGTQTITCDQNGAVYRLKETGRGQGIETYNMNYTSTYSNTNFTNTSATWTTTGADQGATDAHWGAEKTYDYYFLNHNRSSIDGNGFKLLSYIHYQSNYTNAFWDGQRMTYGDGSTGSGFKIFTALDICGHEITHGLTGNTAGLIYSNESGALNEAFSDIFGSSIENYARPNNWNWKIGEDITNGGGGLRSMSNPNSFGDPDTYLSPNNWYAGTADNGGVHTNSGVINYWYYLLTIGGSGTNDIGNAFSVSGLGFTKASKIAFRALTVYFTPTTDFLTARNLSVLAATDLYGACSVEVEQTKRAWYAVGVGPNFSNTVVGPNFQSISTNFCTLPATVNFSNTTTNGQSFIWDFGDGTTSTSSSPSHIYINSGNYNVKLKAIGCANLTDSITKPSFVTINVPPFPVSLGAVKCGGGPVTLTATATGTLNWYLSPFSAPFGAGNNFVTPNITSNTTFYVSNVVANPPSTGGLTAVIVATLGNWSNTNGQYLKFDVAQNCVLNSVVVHAQLGGSTTIELRDSFGTLITSTPVLLAAGANTVTLNYNLAPGNDYRLGRSTTPSISLFRSTGNVNFPYNVASCINIKGSSGSAYFWFYNWTVTAQDCVSPAVAVTASIFPALSVSATAPKTTLCVGEGPVALNGSPSGGVFVGTNVNAGSFYPNNSGNFDVTYQYISPNGCSDSSVVNMSVLLCTGIENNIVSNKTINIYPNPASDDLYIHNELSNATLLISDAAGRQVFQQEIFTGDTKLKINGLANGLYFVNVVDDEKHSFRKIKFIKN